MTVPTLFLMDIIAIICMSDLSSLSSWPKWTHWGCRREPCPAVWIEDIIKIIAPKLGRQNAPLMQDIQRGLFKDTQTLDVPTKWKTINTMWKCESEFIVSGFMNALWLYLYLIKHHEKVIHIWRYKINYGCFLYLGWITLKSFWGYVYSARPCSQCWTCIVHTCWSDIILEKRIFDWSVPLRQFF